MKPLDGITVVSIEQAVAAPLCTRHLADLGARVIKVERPDEGDFARDYDQRVRGLSSHFIWANRSKESVTLNLKEKAELRTLHQLLENADVFVQNLAPGAAERLGLSYEHLRSDHPRLIVCDISGYGSTGPYRDKKAYDLLIQSEAGFLSITGDPNAPAKAGISVADISAAMYAYSGILAALLQRSKTRRGSRIEISMMECMAEWMGHPLYYAFDGASSPDRTGASHASIYPYGPFRTGDDRWVMLGVQTSREWTAFCREVLGRCDLAEDPQFATNAQRSKSRAPLRKAIEEIFSQLTRAEVVEKLEAAAIAHANVNEVSDLWSHPQLRARGRWVEVDTPAGPVPALLPPGLTCESARMGPVPSIGQHNEAIKAELAELEALDISVNAIRG
jgi:crotonobetainyl-CoA:carnitine CoA-transferase CaiB-like acyl-CoA transferase